MAALIEFNDNQDTFRKLISEKQGLFVILFWAESPQCDQIFDVMKELAKNCSSSTITFVKVKADELDEACEFYKVEVVPTVLFLKQGSVLDRVTGANAAILTQKVVAYSSGPAASNNLANDKEALTKHLKALISRAPIMLFMKGNPNQPRCKFSREIVNILASQGVTYDSFDILSDEIVRQGLKELIQWPTYPQLYINGEFVGGVDIIKELAANGELKQMLPTTAQYSTIEDKLKAIINREKVMLFMKGTPQTPRCGFSKTIVDILTQTGVKYGSFDILEDESVRQALKEYSNWPTYPQLYVNGDLVGGLDIVRDLKESGELNDVLTASST